MTHSPDSQNTAASVIAKFGGINPCARAVGLAASTVQGWKERGTIPAQRQPEVLEAAARQGIALDAYDFLPPHLRPEPAA